MEKLPSIENPEPGLIEKMKRLVGLGTLHVIGMEERTQSQQRMANVMHERGSEGFQVVRAAETGLKQYRRK